MYDECIPELEPKEDATLKGYIEDARKTLTDTSKALLGTKNLKCVGLNVYFIDEAGTLMEHKYTTVNLEDYEDD